jgi:hypothetical protein
VSSGYVYLYLGQGTAPELDVFGRLLEPVGLRLENPGVKEVFVLSEEGDQTRTTRDWIVSQLSAKRVDRKKSAQPTREDEVKEQ